MNKTNLEMLRIAVENLGALKDELVFVGGCTTELFITDEGAAELRATKDVDAIIEAASYSEYIEFSDKLKAINFHEDTSEDAPMCRWVKGSTILDVMPLAEEALGFTNRWYKSALETAENHEFIPGYKIKVVSPVYFCATKMEAFDGRGNNDYLGSHDLEDIVAVIDGRKEIIGEIENSTEKVRHYITKKVKTWLTKDKFLDALAGHLGSRSDQGRMGVLIKRLKQIAN